MSSISNILSEVHDDESFLQNFVSICLKRKKNKIVII